MDSYDDPEPSTIPPDIAAKYGVKPLAIRHKAEIQVQDEWLPIQCNCDILTHKVLRTRIEELERRIGTEEDRSSYLQKQVDTLRSRVDRQRCCDE